MELMSVKLHKLYFEELFLDLQNWNKIVHFTGSHDSSRHTHPQVITFVLHPIETDCLLHTGLMTVVFFLG